MNEITLGKMVDLRKNTSLFIPANWVTNFNEEKNDYAIFLKNNPTMFRFIPTKADKVVQFHMKLSVLEENFLQRLFQVFEKIHKEFEIKPMYSSGVCFVEEECYYFFLIEKVSDEVEDRIKSLLVKLESVEEIIIKNYGLN